MSNVKPDDKGAYSQVPSNDAKYVVPAAATSNTGAGAGAGAGPGTGAGGSLDSKESKDVLPTGNSSGSGGGGGPDSIEVTTEEVHDDYVENECFVNCMNRYVSYVQPHYTVILILYCVFAALWIAVYCYSIKVYASHRNDTYPCEAGIVKWLLFDAIVGLLFWLFAGGVIAVLPVTFKHLHRAPHEEFHDSFFGLYCLWLLWIIAYMILLVMKALASVWFYRDIDPVNHFCMDEIYLWGYWVVTIGWGVQGAGVVAFLTLMTIPAIKESCANKPAAETEKQS